MPALADAMTGPTDRARSHRAEAASARGRAVRQRARAAPTRLPGSQRRSSTSTSTPRPTRTRVVPWGSFARRDEAILCSACTRSAQDLVRRREAGGGHRTPRRRDRGRAPARSPPALAGNLFNRSVVAVAVGDLATAPSPPPKRQSSHAPPRRRLRHGWAAPGLQASCSNPRTGPRRRAAPRPRRWRGVDAHPRRLEGVLPRAAHAVPARARSPSRGRARSRAYGGRCSGRAASPRDRLGRSPPPPSRCTRGDRPRYRTRSRFGRCRRGGRRPISRARFRARLRAER